MKFKYFLVLLLSILNVNNVNSLAEDVVQLREHFITNLIEEHRENLHQKLTDEIQQSINARIETFMGMLNEPQVRRRREADNLHLNEEGIEVDVLKGFEHRGVVPINFPQDICMFRINEISVAVGLRYVRNGDNVLTIYKRDQFTFRNVFEFSSKHLIKIDCRAVGNVGYVAVVNSISSADESSEIPSSFVYSVKINDRNGLDIDTMQIFPEPNQINVRLWSRNDELFLIYTYSANTLPSAEKCTLYKLLGESFNATDFLPCQNSRVVEFFTIRRELFIFIGNYRELNGTTNTFSSIMRFNSTTGKFNIHQKLYTNAIRVGKYFYLDYNHQRQHFLFIGNTYELNEFGAINYDVPSIVYKFVNGFFVPLQTINVKHVKDVAPIERGDFHLLITSEDTEVQIFYFDGWKFQESNLVFTGAAFGAGVKSMRVYDNIIENTTTLIIANANMNENQWNVYTPIFVKKKDSTQIKTSILKWCNDAFQRVNQFNVEKSDEMLKFSLNLTDETSDEIHFMSNVFLKNATIGLIHTNEFIYRDRVLNKEKFDRINMMKRRSDQMKRDVERLRQKIHFAEATRRTRRQASEITKRLIVEESLNVETINGKSIANLVFSKNSKNRRMKSIVARQVVIKEEFFVSGKIDGIDMREDNLIINVPRQFLRPLSVKKLIVKNINHANVNGMSFNDFFALLKRKIDPKIPNSIHELSVESIKIEKLLNGRNITLIVMNSLKTEGRQLFTAPIKVKSLRIKELNFDRTLEKISDVSLGNLIDISNPKPIEILQDIRFVEPLEVNQLFVKDRINNVNIKEGKILVLRTDGVDEQTITGEKIFETVNLLEPIVLRGKIESKTLERMNPVASIDKNLVLNGDFVIKGPVIIQKFLNVTEDVVSSNAELGLRKLGSLGLNLNASNTTSNKLIFKDVVQVKGDLSARSINNIPVNLFVKLDSNSKQTVRGKKTFTKNLRIKGSLDVDVVNDVDLKRLDETTLKRSSNSIQFIDGNVQMASLQVDQVSTRAAKVNGKDINLIFSRKQPQQLTQVRAKNLRANKLTASKMDHNIGSKVFANDLNFLIDDTITADSFIDTVIAEKTFTNLNVKNLLFAEGNEWKEIIGNFESILQGFNITSDTTFENEMEIRSLVVKGKINGVPYSDMINNWLKLEGDQSFTVPQAFEKLTVQNVNLSTLNGVSVNQLLEESIYTDEPITIDDLHVSGRLAVNKNLLTPLVNGATFNDKIILNQTQDYQKLMRVKVKREAFIQHLNYTFLNEIDCSKFLSIFNGNDEPAPSLKVIGKAIFSRPVNVTFLNNVMVQDLFDTTWLSNRDVLLTGDDIQFLDVSRIDGSLYIDSLNNRNLDELFNNYLSKSKDQFINRNINVIGNVFATKNLYAFKSIVPKLIKIDENSHFNVTELAESSFRHNTTQEISGNWKIRKLVLYGSYDGLINGFNIREDILHARNLNNFVVGFKQIKKLDAHDVHVNFINDINVKDWFLNAVRNNGSGEQYIDGHVTFKKFTHMENNLQVYGTVNDIVITPQTVLLKNRENQVIHGDVTFFIADPKNPNNNGRSNQIFIDRLVLRDNINNKNWQEIHANVLRPDSDNINAKVVFEKELHVDSLQTNKSIYETDMMEFLKGSSVSNNMVKFKKNMEHLSEIGDDMIRSLSDNVVELSHFEFIQTINSNDLQKSVLFSINRDYFLAMHEKNSTHEVINFFKWNRESRKFIIEPTMAPIQYNADAFQIVHFFKIVYRGIDHLYLEFFDRKANSFNQNLLFHDTRSGTFVRVVELSSINSAKFFTWKDGLAPCYGAIYKSIDSIVVNCEGMPQTVIQAESSVRKISSQNDKLILLTDDGKVRVWRDQKFFNIPNLINPQSFSSIEFNDRMYLAIITDEVEGTIHHGDIHIFESSVKDLKFKRLQKLSLHVPTEVKFSKAPSGDLLLYVLTRNEPKAFYVFSYAGGSNFVPSIGDDTIIKKASNLDVIQIDGDAEMVSIVAGDNLYIIQAVINQF